MDEVYNRAYRDVFTACQRGQTGSGRHTNLRPVHCNYLTKNVYILN